MNGGRTALVKSSGKRGEEGNREGIGRETAKIKVHFSRSTKT